MVVGHLTRDLLGGSYLGKKTHPNHGGRRRPTAAMVPHSRRRDIRQSANMLGDCSMQRLRVWGAPWRPQSTIFMSRRVDGRSFFLWFVSYVGIRRTHTGKSVMPSRHKVRKSIYHHCRHRSPSAWQPPGRIGRPAAFAGKAHCGGTMRGGGGVREGGGGGVRGLFLQHEKKRIDRSWRVAVVVQPPMGPRSRRRSTQHNQPTCYATSKCR